MQRYFFERFPVQIQRLNYCPADDSVCHRMQDEKVVFFGSRQWDSVREDLSAVAGTDRPQFLLSLFMLVLADQTLQSHFRDVYPRWRQLTYIPKFGPASAGAYNDNPFHILWAPERERLIDLEFALIFVPDCISFMSEELERFLGEVLPEVSSAQFFDRMLDNPAFVEARGVLSRAVHQELRSRPQSSAERRVA